MARVIYGDTGGNQLNASADKTQVYGLAGNDTLVSDSKSDVLLIGGSGDDSLIMQGGNGTLSGGKGSDVFNLSYSADKKLSAVIEDLEPSSDKIIVNFDGDTAPQLTSKVSGNDVVLKDNDGLISVTLKGVRENDYFDGSASNEIWNVLWLTNEEREKENLPALTLSEGLMKGASIRAEEINGLAQTGALSNHTRPDGTPYHTVLDGKYNYTGENLDGGAQVPIFAINDWMNSQSHKENILRKNFQKLGVGYLEDDPDPSNHRWYWTQEFADSLKSPETVSTAELSAVDSQVNTVTKSVAGNDEANTIENTVYGATIDARGGNDKITNTGAIASISGGADNDTIDNSGSFVTVNAGTGDDIISLSADSKGNVIEYSPGDGNDTVYGFNDTSTLSLSSDEYYFPVIGSGKDVVVTVGENKITLVDAAKSLINTHSPKDKILRGTEGNDTINNIYDTELTIQSSDGNDLITNWNNNVSISGGEENDTITNYGDSVTINGERGYNVITNRGSKVSIYGAVFSIILTSEGLQGYGRSTVSNYGETVTIEGGAGNDRLNNYGDNVTVLGGAGNDRIYNDRNISSVSIEGGNGDDTIQNHGKNVTIGGGAGNDSVDNYGASLSIDTGAGKDTVSNNSENVTINAGDDNDYITNNVNGSSVSINSGTGDDDIGNFGSDVTIISGAGHDSVYNDVDSSSVKIDCGAGVDTILNFGANTTINAGLDEDIIRLATSSKNNLILYKPGDGSDTIQGLSESDTLDISGSEYTPVTIDSDIVLEVGTDYIWLSNATSLKSALNIVGNKKEQNRLITLTEDDDDFFETVKFGATIDALGDDDFISNSTDYVTINGGNGDDYLSSSGNEVNINGDAGDDKISNYGNYVTISGGLGDDSISLYSYSRYNLIRYEMGDGSDTINGFNNYSILDISNSDYTPVTVGNDVVISVGTDSITLVDAATLSSVRIMQTRNNTVDGATIQATDDGDYIINHGSNVLIEGGKGNDSIGNGTSTLPGGDNVTISGNAGNDYIVNSGSGVSIEGNAGNDTVNNNSGSNIIINGGSGKDFVGNRCTNVTINGGADDDTVENHGYETTILGGAGNDSLHNGWRGVSVSMDGGAGDDIIVSRGVNVTINGGAGKDAIINNGSSVSIDGGIDDDQIVSDASEVTIIGGAGNDSIGNNWNGSSVSIDGGLGDDTIGNHGSNVTINAGIGKDLIYNDGSNVSIDSGIGNDTISNLGSDVTINTGTGNDYVYIREDAKNNLVLYTPGDGNDTIEGSNETYTLKILTEDKSIVSSVFSGDDIICTVGDNTLLLKGGRDNPPHIIIGESGSASGTDNNNGGDDNNSSTGKDNNNSGNNNGTEGGVSSNEGRSNAASSGRSATGSSGRGTSSGIDSGGNGSRRNPTAQVSSTGTQQTSSNNFDDVLNSLHQNQQNQPAATVNQHVYAGGNQIISNYQSGEKIIFGAVYTGSFFDNTGNYCVGSSTGALVVQNAMDKVIDLSDYAGNAFVKAYAASTAGVIDGRGIAGFEIINGSAGTDIIYAGDGNSQLWGGNGDDGDILVGGNGSDIFIGGKTQGADIFLNASSTDIVHLNDATLSDIVATAEENGTIGIQFNNGNVVAVQSSEPMSAAIMLADGSAYRFNHATRSWQSA